MILIATGHTVQITVRRGCLTIKDESGERRIERQPRIYTRLVINARIGMLTLDAQAWMHNYGMSWVNLYRESANDSVRSVAIAASIGGEGNPEVWSAQITADPLPVMRMLIGAKLDGQAANAELLHDPDTAKKIHTYAERVALADSHLAILGLEGKAAELYWKLWRSTVRVPWIADEMLRVPPRWLDFSVRKSLAMTGSNRRATDPLNAMLNFAYKVGESLCIEACYAAEMSPVLGLAHNRRYTRAREGDGVRPSMALDLLEAARPACDRAVLDLLDYGQGIKPYLKWTDFLELDSGVVRVESLRLRERLIKDTDLARETVTGYAMECVGLLCGSSDHGSVCRRVSTGMR